MVAVRSALCLGGLLLAAALSACASGGHARFSSASAGIAYPGITCAPFARELSGIALYGDAASWWDQADGRYTRGGQPVLGAALVFRREQRLPSGHVSVVSRILDRRRIEVTEANWVPGELSTDQLVVDVSERNDWSEVRVWWPPVDQLGSHTYPTYGFIEPGVPVTHEVLARVAPTAARISLSSANGRPPPRARTMAGL